jgi:hypothetical protein
MDGSPSIAELFTHIHYLLVSPAWLHWSELSFTAAFLC